MTKTISREVTLMQLTARGNQLTAINRLIAKQTRLGQHATLSADDIATLQQRAATLARVCANLAAKLA